MRTLTLVGTVNLLLTIIYNAGFKVIYSKLDNRFHLDGIHTKLLSSDVHCHTCNDIRTIQRGRR